MGVPVLEGTGEIPQIEEAGGLWFMGRQKSQTQLSD